MQYRFLKKAFGTGKKSLDISFEFDKNIFDICLIDDGAIFIADDYPALGFIGFDGSFNPTWMGNPEDSRMRNGDASFSRFIQPSGIFKDDKFVYIFDDNGKCLRHINVGNKYIESLTGRNYEEQFRKYCKRGSRLHGIHLGGIAYIFASSKANKCFFLQGNKIVATIGDGKPRYCVSDYSRACSFHQPMGLSFLNGEILISDSKNKCIRSFNMNTGRVSLFMGNPSGIEGKNSLKLPKKIVVKKNQLFILDDNKIKFSGSEMHSSENIKTFDIDTKLNACVLEEI
jgi:hypothetical protein